MTFTLVPIESLKRGDFFTAYADGGGTLGLYKYLRRNMAWRCYDVGPVIRKEEGRFLKFPEKCQVLLLDLGSSDS